MRFGEGGGVYRIEVGDLLFHWPGVSGSGDEHAEIEWVEALSESRALRIGCCSRLDVVASDVRGGLDGDLVMSCLLYPCNRCVVIESLYIIDIISECVDRTQFVDV